MSDHADVRAVAHEPAPMASRERVEACGRQLGAAGADLPVWKKMIAQERLDLFFGHGHASFQVQDRMICLSSFVVSGVVGGRMCVYAMHSIENIAA